MNRCPFFRPSVVVLLAAGLVACATPGPAARQAAALARYEAAAGEPVDSFRFFRASGFTVLGDEVLAVWTGPSEAWLLRVDPPCSELSWQPAIGLTSSLGRVSVRFDEVLAGRDRCRIREIRPVDGKALREAERAARGAIQPVERAPEPSESPQPSGGT